MNQIPSLEVTAEAYRVSAQAEVQLAELQEEFELVKRSRDQLKAHCKRLESELEEEEYEEGPLPYILGGLLSFPGAVLGCYSLLSPWAAESGTRAFLGIAMGLSITAALSIIGSIAGGATARRLGSLSKAHDHGTESSGPE